MSDVSYLSADLSALMQIWPGPLIIPWPSRGSISGLVSFSTISVWRDAILRLSLPDGIPQIVAAKFRRAQKLYLLGWIDADLIKAGELVGLSALELALKDRYGLKPFAHLLKHMVEKDRLTDRQLPIVLNYGGAAVGRLTGESRPTLAEIRNSLAHGDPFDGAPYSGLLELIRDLIQYAYRSLLRGAIGSTSG